MQSGQETQPISPPRSSSSDDPEPEDMDFPEEGDVDYDALFRRRNYRRGGDASAESIPESARLKINMRERQRMHDLNSSMDLLRQVIPHSQGPNVKKVSKMTTLLLARNYIVALRRSLEDTRGLLSDLYRRQLLAPSLPLASSLPPLTDLLGLGHQAMDPSRFSRSDSKPSPLRPSVLSPPREALSSPPREHPVVSAASRDLPFGLPTLHGAFSPVGDIGRLQRHLLSASCPCPMCCRLKLNVSK